MFNCEYYQELMSRMIDGDLSNDEREVLACHLKQCPDCLELFKAFNAVSQQISDDLVEPPEALHENIMAGIRRADIMRRNSVSYKRAWAPLVAVAACFVLILAGFVGSKDRQSSPALYQESRMPANVMPMEAAPADSAAEESAPVQQQEEKPAATPAPAEAPAATPVPTPAADRTNSGTAPENGQGRDLGRAYSPTPTPAPTPAPTICHGVPAFPPAKEEQSQPVSEAKTQTDGATAQDGENSQSVPAAQSSDQPADKTPTTQSSNQTADNTPASQSGNQSGNNTPASQSGNQSGNNTPTTQSSDQTTAKSGTAAAEAPSEGGKGVDTAKTPDKDTAPPRRAPGRKNIRTQEMENAPPVYSEEPAAESIDDEVKAEKEQGTALSIEDKDFVALLDALVGKPEQAAPTTTPTDTDSSGEEKQEMQPLDTAEAVLILSTPADKDGKSREMHIIIFEKQIWYRSCENGVYSEPSLSTLGREELIKLLPQAEQVLKDAALKNAEVKK